MVLSCPCGLEDFLCLHLFCHDQFLLGQSLVQREAKGQSGSKLQGLKWLRGDAPQRRVDARVSDARESSTQGSRSLQCRFWVGGEQVKLCAKALKSEQGLDAVVRPLHEPSLVRLREGWSTQEVSKSIFELRENTAKYLQAKYEGENARQ